ncbi:MAG: DUF370 domain-containing protein [Oscillospiraceae bacterium]|jgi:hypothetical protein|nr:DUF370 domain-containing protein [Oscillospiraceae bacterium]
MDVSSRNNGRRALNAYAYLGGCVTVHGGDIIGIFDIERVTVNKNAEMFLRNCQKNGKIRYVSAEMPKSFVVTDEKVYVAGVSVQTVKKRASGSF